MIAKTSSSADIIETYLRLLASQSLGKSEFSLLDLKTAEEEFVRVALSYAKQNKITYKAFIECKVPVHALKRAGIKDERKVLADFARDVQIFARANHASYEDFRKMGLSAELLKSAGIKRPEPAKFTVSKTNSGYNK